MKSWMHHTAATLLGSLLFTTPALALSPEQQVQQGINQYNSGQYRTAIQAWESALRTYQQAQDYPRTTIVLENLARAYQQTGQGERELQHWDQLIAAHTQLRDESQVGRSLTEKAQALSRQGQTQTAIAILCGKDSDFQQCAPGTALTLAQKNNDRKTQAAALGSLGEAYRLRGDYTKALPILAASLTLAQTENLPTYQAAAHNSLGNTYSNQALNRYRRAESFQKQSKKQSEQLLQDAVKHDRKALDSYKQSLENQNPQGKLRSLTNLIPIYHRLKDTQSANATWQSAEQLRRQLPNSRTKAYATIDLAALLQPNPADRTTDRLACDNVQLTSAQITQTETLLKEGAAIAKAINDPRAESYALGELGHRYECQGNYPQALEITRAAQLAADQSLSAKDSLYLWEWQIGRILKAQGKLNGSQAQTNGAIAAYERAVAILETIRGDILTSNRDVQFDFRDTIDPIYRELVELKLNQTKAVQITASLPNAPIVLNDAQPALKSAIQTIDSLKLAEIQNYFGNDCIIGLVRKPIDQVNDEHAAVINTIILNDRAAVTLTLPTGEQKFVWIPAHKQEITRVVTSYRRGLTAGYEALAGYDKKEPAQQVYDWIIQPFEADLAAQPKPIKTLVFVQDGIFRSVPMAALHNKKTQKFLIQDYAIAIAPSLSLVDPQPLDRKKLKILAMGFSQGSTINGQFRKALTNVTRELEDISAQIPATQTLLNDNFNQSRLKTELQANRYSILHIATHGKFGSEPEDTFVITGEKQGGDNTNVTLNFNDLDQLIRANSKNKEPLDLLMLTACETAIGDDRSTLGLAGVAVQSGARTAIAPLWQVNDTSAAELSNLFYRNLKQPAVNNEHPMSKSAALRQAQIDMIQGKLGLEFSHPYHWSGFVLVGNWL
jgi:CHAT domain-containing protein